MLWGFVRETKKILNEKYQDQIFQIKLPLKNKIIPLVVDIHYSSKKTAQQLLQIAAYILY